MRGYGKYSDQNSRDYSTVTFGDRTVLESELIESLSLAVATECCWSIEKLVCFKHAL